MIEIQTARLLLRTPKAGDLAGYLEYRNDPAALAIQGMTGRSEKEAIEFLHLQAELPLEAGGWRMFSIQERKQPGIIGEVGVFVPDDRNEGDIGWWLNARWQGKGFAAEAARGLIEWCFSVRSLRRITAHCLADHVASLRVLERIGMRVELRSLESRLINGVWRDEVGGAMLLHEWRKRKI